MELTPHDQTLALHAQAMGDSVRYVDFAGFRSLQDLPGTSPLLYLSGCGEEKCEPGYFYDQPHPIHNLHVVLRGKGFYRVNGKTYPLEKGDLFLCPAKKDGYYQADTQEPWHYTWVSVDGKRCSEYLEQAGFTPDNPVRPCYAPPEEYHRLILEMLEARTLTHANALRRTGRLYSFFSLLIRSRWPSTEGTRTARDTNVNKTIQFIHSNYARTNVEEVAEYVGLNRSYLTSLFRQETGVTVQKYLILYRMEKAAQLLKTTNRTVQAIAQSVGYEDPFTFTKVFHRTYGMSPRDYRSTV